MKFRYREEKFVIRVDSLCEEKFVIDDISFYRREGRYESRFAMDKKIVIDEISL